MYKPFAFLLIKQITLSSVESFLHYQKPTEPTEMSKLFLVLQSQYMLFWLLKDA